MGAWGYGMASRALSFRVVRSSDRRDDIRHIAVVTRATVRGVAQEPCGAALQDVSLYGCRLVSTDEHAPDEAVWLRLNGSMPIAARVVWSRDGMLGCRFDAPIERALLRSLMMRVV